VVCMRIEDAKGSSVAIRMSGKHVIPKLLELGYIKSFEAKPVVKAKQRKVVITEPGEEERNADSL
jgi:hypothetical protein